MKIYTKQGDGGQTGLFGGPRVFKDHARIEAYGAVDELNSLLGVVRAEGLPEDQDQLLGRVQHELFSVGAELATPEGAAGRAGVIGTAQVAALEAAIDRYQAALPPLKQFILPGGTKRAAGLHFARSVCRRAERRVVTLRRSSDEAVSDALLSYLNRLSDLLFVLARCANAAAGRAEVPWQEAPGMQRGPAATE